MKTKQKIPNKNQKAFLKTLMKSFEQSCSAREIMFKALETEAVDEEKKQQCREYIRHLQNFAEAAERMMMECQLAYGRPAWMVAADAMKNKLNEN